MKRILFLIALVALLVGASLALAACAGDIEQATTGTGGPTAQSADGSSTTVPVWTPVSGQSPVSGLAFPQTTGEAGSGRIEGSVTYRGTLPKDSVLVTLRDRPGDFLYGTFAADSYAFEHLAPGSYRLAVTTWNTGYISQWYGGLPCQGHTAEESQTVEVGEGVTRADFVLEPGRSITGRVTWSGGPRAGAWVLLFDEAGRLVTVSARTSYADPDYLIVGLVPGKYRVGAMFDDWNKGPDYWNRLPETWYGGGDSLQGAAVVDLTSADASGIDVDLGDLPGLPNTTIP